MRRGHTGAAAIATSVVALLTALTGCGLSVADPDLAPSSPTSAELTSARCADVVVLGLRGQGQSAKTNQGMGREVLLSASALVPRLPDGTTARLAAVLHPARLSPSTDSYDKDVAKGVRMVQEQLSSLADDCPRSSVVLIGFSEGAQVVHKALATSATDASHLALAVLIGDPLRDPEAALRTVDFGTELDGQGSNGAGADFPAAIRQLVVEVCTRKDNVCNAPLSGRVGGVSGTHKSFYEKATSVRTIADAAVIVYRTG